MTEIEKLLYATDISQPRFSEVERLLALRTLGLKEITFLCTTKVEAWERNLADYGINSKTLMADGPMVRSILNVTHQKAVSLVVASFKRDRRKLLRKSQTTDLVQSSAVPVIIMHEEPEVLPAGQKDIFAHVIFATNWSPASEKALRFVLRVKEIIKELEIVYVVDKRPSVKDMRESKEKLVQTRMILSDNGVDAEFHIYAGKRWEEIMLSAKDYDATCIIMGNSGKSVLNSIWSQSCSCRVAERSLVPTLVVP